MVITGRIKLRSGKDKTRMTTSISSEAQNKSRNRQTDKACYIADVQLSSKEKKERICKNC